VAVEAIKSVHGKAYQYGPSGPTLYVSSGGSNDYTYGALNVTYSYVVELRDTGTTPPPTLSSPHNTMGTAHAHSTRARARARTDGARCAGRYGFVLPPSEIVPTGEESFAAVRVFANYILRDL
jgi:hypothetical protein